MDESKVEGYVSDLKEVEEALKVSPDNAELLKLRDDLKELIALCKEQAIPEAPAPPKAATGDNEVLGRTCIVSSTFNYAFVERIVAIEPETGLPTKLGVRLFGDDEVVDVDASDVRLLGPFDAQSLAVGSQVQGLYDDGVWYNCTVKAKPKNGLVKISYDEYNEEDEIALDRIRSRGWAPHDKKKGSVTVKKETVAKKAIVTPGGYTIPTAILVRPGDSAAVREQKRRQLEHLKREQKKQKVDAEYEERQKSWQEHMKTAQAKFRTQLTFTRRKR